VHSRGIELLLDALVVIQPSDRVIELVALVLFQIFLDLRDRLGEPSAI
jgi:hypothetical protein